MNPILRKELRSMLRERRGWLVPVLYAAVLAAAVAMFFVPFRLGHSDVTELGSLLAGVVAVMQAFTIALFAPLVGAGAIAGERERGTWTRLLAAPIERGFIVLGKAGAVCAYVLVLLSVSLPIAGLSLLYGGADLETLAGLYLTHAIVGVALACMGLAVSTLFQRTWTAAIVAVACAFGLMVFTLALFVLLNDFGGQPHWSSDPWPRAVLLLNPGYGLFLFFAGDRRSELAADWWCHYGALLALAGGCLLLTVHRVRAARD